MARSCSGACSVFFEADLSVGEEPPDRTKADNHRLLRPQTLLDLGQGQIRVSLDQREQPRRLPGQLGTRVTATGLSTGAARVAASLPIALSD